MQKMTRIYQNRIAVDMAEKGWCILQYRMMEPADSLWGKDKCLVFFSSDFVPDQRFGAKLEKLCNKICARLLWIENPAAEPELWKMTNGSWEYPHIRIGKYWIHIKKLISEADCKMVFQGTFGVGGTCFPLSEEAVTLSLDDASGVLAFELSVKPESFSELEAGIRYLRILPSDVEKGEERNYTERFACSVFYPESEIDVSGSICPVDLGNHEISSFRLPVCNWNSTFLTPQGTTLSLRSEEGARLVFERTAEAVSFDKAGGTFSAVGISWYLGIEGDFLLRSNAQVMPGLAGTEYISEVGKLRFLANKPGLLGMDEVEDDATDRADSFCIVTAPWLSIQGTYHSSAASMPFFSEQDGYLRNCVPKIMTFENFSKAFPVMPWKGIHYLSEDSDATAAENLLLRRRFQILTETMDTLTTGVDEEQLLVTPCGICVGLEKANGNWNWVGIAQIDGTGLPDIRLYNPALPVRMALQKTACVLTASTLDGFQELSETPLDLSFCIEGWKLCFSAETWTEHSLFMIKYTKSASIRSLLGECVQLNNVLKQAYDSNGVVKKEFELFLKMIDDTEFQGILLLGGAAEADGLSPELKAVLDFTGKSGAAVVYAAVSNGRVAMNDTGFSVGRSNVTALISYTGEPEQREDGVPFEFCTRDLTVLIEQSHIRYFQSHSELSIYRLFGSELYVTDQRSGSCLVLTGRIEEVNGQQTYKFLLDAPVSYMVSDSALASVVVQNVEMSAGEGMLCFLLQGQQTYTVCDGFDLFSYDRIEFGGVSLIKKSHQLFADYSSYELYSDRAVIRENSFVEAFGAQIRETLCDVLGQTPEDRGYFSINAPVKQSVPGDRWNGIVWQISLNSSGSLGKNEPLSLELLAGWSGSNYYVGVRMGGIFGRGFSFQGILTAGFTGITMEKGDGGKVFLHLYSFSVKALGLSLPQKGADVYILGEQGNVAWYAAYDDGGKENGTL